MTSKYLAATAITALLTIGAGYPALSQSTSGSDGPAMEADCPEDMDNEPGCGIDAPVSERQPVEGAATAPVAPEVGDSGTTTIAKPEDAAPAEDSSGSNTGEGGSDTASGRSESATEPDCPEDMDKEPGCGIDAPVSERQPVEGAATAPVEPEVGDSGTTTIAEPDDTAPAEDSSGSDMDSGESEPASDDQEQGEDASEAPGAEDPNIAVAYEEGGRYFTEDDIPTFNVSASGEVDWLTYSGFRRYHSECHVCHGPDGEGSSYAPALKNSALNMDYYEFYNVVVNGIQHVGASENSVMPAFGDNQNVMCYLDDIYVYLKARGAGAVARGRPADKVAKSDMIQEAENACMGV